MASSNEVETSYYYENQIEIISQDSVGLYFSIAYIVGVTKLNYISHHSN